VKSFVGCLLATPRRIYDLLFPVKLILRPRGVASSARAVISAVRQSRFGSSGLRLTQNVPVRVVVGGVSRIAWLARSCWCRRKL
jgi:hypothetical protein